MVGRSIYAKRPDALDVGRIGDAGLHHRVAGALDRAAHARLADEHVVRLFREHEAAGARERIEARLREAFQLHLAVTVGEEREHEEREPVRGRLVEGAEHARASSSPERRRSRSSASSRPSRPKYFWSR
jgi:hypothetical protein